MNYIFTLLASACLHIGLVAPISLSIHRGRLMFFAAPALAAVGAYTYGLAVTSFEIPFAAALFLAGLSGWLSGWTLGSLISHLTDEVFGIATLAIQLVVWQVLINWESVTRGSFGLVGIPGPEFFGVTLTSPALRSVAPMIFAIVSVAICGVVAYSLWGRALSAAANDETLLKSFGTSPYATRRNFFGLSGIIFGIGGGLYAAYYSFIDPGTFGLPVAVSWFVMAIVGRGPIWIRPVTGVLVFLAIEEILRFIGLPDRLVGWGRHAIFGFLLALVASRWGYITKRFQKAELPTVKDKAYVK